jgi:hypothetical protein
LRFTRQDVWLRTRAGRWELKKPVECEGGTGLATIYDELEEDGLIAAYLGIIEPLTEGILREMGIAPFGTVVTTRRSYDIPDSGVKVRSAGERPFREASFVRSLIHSLIPSSDGSFRWILTTQRIPTVTSRGIR